MGRPTRRKAAAGTLVLALAMLASLPALGALYKWVDSNGRVVYSDQPPVGNFKFEMVGAAPAPANPDAAKELASKDAEFKKRQLDRVEDAKKADKTRADTQRNLALCVQARSQLAGLKRADYAIYRLNEKGERVLMDDAMRRTESERLEQILKDRNCPPANG